MTIKEKIRAIRESKGISLAFIADNLGMERSNYSRLERAVEDRIYFDTIEKVCKALGITIYELLAYGEKDGSNGHPLADSVLSKEVEKLKGEKMELLESIEEARKGIEEARLRFANKTLIVEVLPFYIKYILHNPPMNRPELSNATSMFIEDYTRSVSFWKVARSLEQFFDEEKIKFRLRQDLIRHGLDVLGI